MHSLLNAQQIAVVKEKLTSATSIAITTHKNPDGDAIGSSLGLMNFLRSLGLTANVILPNDSPPFLKWMKGFSETVDHSKDKDHAEGLINKADVLFCLDFNTPSRVSELETTIRESKAYKVLIDHHPEPENFVDLMISRPEVGSTCELIYSFIRNIWNDKPIGADVADCLYTGIMTDSGSFRFPSTSSETHRTVADLMDQGADHAKIHMSVYDDSTENRLRLLGHCLSNKLVVMQEFATAYIYLSAEELEKFFYTKGDTEGIVNYPLGIKGIVMSAIFIEKDGQIKISFRSKGDFSVNRFSRENFNGGGHTNAAGGSSDLTLAETIEKFVALLPKYDPQLSRK